MGKLKQNNLVLLKDELENPQLDLLRHKVNHFEMDVSGDVLDTAVVSLDVVNSTSQSCALFGHPDYCQSERTPETLQLFLLRHEVNHLEMDVSRDLLDTAVGVNGFFG